MDFYGEVLRQLVVALGAALFLGNVLALFRRRPVPRDGTAARRGDGDTVLVRAPVARSLTYAAVGLVVMVWGLASLLAG